MNNGWQAPPIVAGEQRQQGARNASPELYKAGSERSGTEPHWAGWRHVRGDVGSAHNWWY
jgi:hypothetical protein